MVSMLNLPTFFFKVSASFAKCFKDGVGVFPDMMWLDAVSA